MAVKLVFEPSGFAGGGKSFTGVGEVVQIKIDAVLNMKIILIRLRIVVPILATLALTSCNLFSSGYKTFTTKIADIWNTASIVHNSPVPNWGTDYSHPYDSRSLFEHARTVALGDFLDSVLFTIPALGDYHTDIVTGRNRHLMTVSYSLLGGR